VNTPTTFRASVACLAGSLLVLSPGCVVGLDLGRGSLRAPGSERLLANAQWDDLTSYVGTEGGEITSWWLPGILAIDWMQVAPDEASAEGEADPGEIAGSGDDRIALAWAFRSYGPYSGLPFYSEFDARFGYRDGGEGGIDYYWHPFWTAAKSYGSLGVELTVDSSGIPLFWSELDVDYAEPDADPEDLCRLSFYRFDALWTIGPTFLSLDTEERGDAVTTAEIDYFAPLYLVGLGCYLWTSVSADLVGTTPVSICGHGPLATLLGYLSIDTRAPDQDSEDSISLLAGGILWMSSSKRIAGEAVDSAHGPLWGMLGWGRADGIPTLRVAWFEVPLGSK
jgi:hypothetical protein